MPNMKEDMLRELGLSINEAKVYLALLRSGVAGAGKVSDQCKLHRTNVYDALERLEQKGLVSYILKEDTKLFEATDPSALKQVLDDQRSRLDAMLPQFALDKQLGKKTIAHVQEGVPAFKIAFFSWLEFGKPIYAYGLPKIAPVVIKSFIDVFHQKRIHKKIMMKHLYNENARERMDFLNGMAYTEAKYLPSEYNTMMSTMVCGDEVFLVHWDTEPMTFIRIESAVLAEAYRHYFDILYAGGKVPDGPLSKKKFSQQ